MKKSLLFLSLFLFANTLFAQDADFVVSDHGEDTYLITSNSDLSNAVFTVGGDEYSIGPETNGLVVQKEDLGKFAFIAMKNNGAKKHKLYYFPKNAAPRSIPFWVSLLPPLFAILFALITKEVVSSLFAGIWVGAWAMNGFSLKGLYFGFLDSMERFVKGAIADSDHVAVILFSMLIGGMVSIISRNGGMAGIVNKLAKYAKSAQKTMLTTWALGLAIFFDDYANTLIVGNTMRPLTDRFRISREKLAYIVDSTAAPISALAFVTTWIGFELSQIETAIADLPEIQMSAYGLFLNSLNYSFYPVLAIFFMLMMILNKVDYGPMLKIERHARATGDVTGVDLDESAEAGDETEELDPVEGKPHRGYNALIPIVLVVFGTLGGLLHTGGFVFGQDGFPNFDRIQDIIGNADSYTALIWGSSLGVASAILLTLFGRILSLKDTMSALVKGFKTMMSAIIILILAWALAATTKELHTADFITNALGDGFSPYLFPITTFIISALISFSTGSSWSTMAILYPLVVPAVWIISGDAGLAESMRFDLLYNTIACVLAGSVFGDHCSPISDTTILSSLASKCNHLSHVKTQFPYALTVGIIAMAIGGGFVFLGLPSWVNYIVGLALCYLAVRFLGKKVDDFVAA